MKRPTLGKTETGLLRKVGTQATFTTKDARKFLGQEHHKLAPAILTRLKRKGWTVALRRGVYAVVPFSSGTTGSAQIHEYVAAMHLVEPAAIAFFSALNHHGLTEQLPKTVFIATDHKVRKRQRTSLGYSFRIVSLRKRKFFGLTRAWIGEQSFQITDAEKTIIDGLDQPKYAGGIGTIARALSSHWEELDHDRLISYAVRSGTSAVLKRLGYLMEALELGDAESLREQVKLKGGYPRLDPTLPAKGRHNRRWGVLVNVRL